MKHQKIIHCKPSGTAVSVCKRMNVFEFCMKISCGCQCLAVWNIEKFFQQFFHFFLYIFWRCACFFPACYIVMMLIFPRPSSQLGSVKIWGVSSTISATRGLFSMAMAARDIRSSSSFSLMGAAGLSWVS